MSKKSITISSIVAVILAAVLVVIGVGSQGFRNWDLTTWFQSGQITEKDPPTNVDGIINVPQSIQFCSALSEGASDYEPQTVGVTVTPSNATIIRCDWSLEWVIAGGPDPDGVVTDYVTFTATEDPLFVTVNCLKAFARRISLKATVVGYGINPAAMDPQEIEYSASTEIGYNKRISEMPFSVNCYSLGKQIHAPQSPYSTINLVIGNDYGLTGLLTMYGINATYEDYTENTGIVGNYSVEYSITPTNVNTSEIRTIDFGEIDLDNVTTYHNIDALKRIQEYETERKDMHYGSILSNGGYISLSLVITVNGKSYRYNARANYVMPLEFVDISGWTDPGSNPLITF